MFGKFADDPRWRGSLSRCMPCWPRSSPKTKCTGSSPGQISCCPARLKVEPPSHPVDVKQLAAEEQARLHLGGHATDVLQRSGKAHTGGRMVSESSTSGEKTS